MNLTPQPDFITRPKAHYIYVERIGPFQDNAPKAWQEFHKLLGGVPKEQIDSGLAVYHPDPAKQIYRAGMILKSAPTDLPAGLKYELLAGGKYCRFVLRGSYANLPAACGVAFDYVAKHKIPRREAFCLEHYTKDPANTPEDQLVTEILIPSI